MWQTSVLILLSSGEGRGDRCGCRRLEEMGWRVSARIFIAHFAIDPLNLMGSATPQYNSHDDFGFNQVVVKEK